MYTYITSLGSFSTTLDFTNSDLLPIISEDRKSLKSRPGNASRANLHIQMVKSHRERCAYS
jgi:hypothetical protein